VVDRAGIPYHGVYPVNNSCLFSTRKSAQLFWEEMMMSMKKYFDILLDTEPVSTKMTYEVLQHREIIEKNIQELQEKVFEGLQALGLLQDSYDAVKKTSSKEASKQKLINIAKRFRATQLEVHKLILESHASFSKLEEIALKPEAFTAIDYIDLLIKNEERNPQRVQALMASREAAKWTAEIRENSDWNPFDRPLEDLKKLGLEIKFDDEDCDVRVLFQEPNGFIRFLKKFSHLDLEPDVRECEFPLERLLEKGPISPFKTPLTLEKLLPPFRDGTVSNLQ
ncbi:unnamed protein product, partial [Darwinula stevensoni]